MKYHNYHKHDYYSNLRTPDCSVSYRHYIDRAIELGHDTFFTTNHGISVNVFEVYDYAKERGIKTVFGVEAYYAQDRFNKESRKNYHLVLIALNKNGYRKINLIQSLANQEGFYFHPRVDLELLLTLPKDDVVVTTACLASPLFKSETYEENFLIPMYEHFGDNFMLEVQNHNHQAQAEHNQKILELNKKYGIKLIHGNDSHYIYEDGLLGKDGRNLYLQSKKMSYDDEDSFVLDYPDYNTIIERYKIQGVLSEQQIKDSINNTLIFDKAEDLNFQKNIKMPNIYPELTPKQRLNKLGKIISENYNKKNIPKGSDEEKKYFQEIKTEFDIIKETNEEVHTADYFLINQKICEKAISDYGGVLTNTGRGSAVSFLINHLINITDIDRTKLDVPMYPTRFISTTRLKMGSLPDVDFNVSNPDAFYKSSMDILGEQSVYPMVAYETLKNSSAFRMVCRYYEIPNEEYNDIAKKIANINSDKITETDEYKKLLQDKKFGKIIKESEQFVGVIDSASIHPCAYLLLSDDIREEIGISKIGENYVCNIDSYYADYWKFLKNDYLRVDVVEIINNTLKLAKKENISINKLLELCDDNVWKLYEDGITETLNQASTDFSKHLVMRYKPKSYIELSAFVAGIRPGFASLLENFIERKPYSNGVKELDDLLFASKGYLLYQESIMMYLQWLGIEEEKTYDIIKQIAKKKFKDGELENLLESLKNNWIDKGYEEDLFYKTWQVVEDAVRYSFNASHSLSVALDSLYCAYLKANYPLEYYTVTLNLYQGNIDKTHNLTEELNYFNITLSPIKFRHSRDEYTFDRETSTIHKGIESIKYMNSKVALELYDLKDSSYNNFLEVLQDISTKTSCNSKQLTILIKLDFFREFGKSQYLLDIVELYKWINKKQIKKADVGKTPFLESSIRKYCGRETEKTYADIDFPNLIAKAILDIENKSITIKELIDTQKEFLGYISIKFDDIDNRTCYVSTIDVKHSPRIEVYLLGNGKTQMFKMNKKYFAQFPIKEGDIIKINKAIKKPKSIPHTDEKTGKVKFTKHPTEFDWWIENYERGML